MSQPPYSPYPSDPYSGQPSSGGPQGYPPPGPPQQPPGYPAPQAPGGYPPPAPSSDGGYPPPPPGGGFPGQQPPGGFPGQQPAGGFPGQPPLGGPPPKKSKAGKIILISLAIILVLCGGGAAVTFFLVKDKVSDVVDAASISVSAPATLGGRAKVTDPELAKTMQDLDGEMANVPGATGSVAGAYGNLKKQDLVMVVAASSLSNSPQKSFDEFTKGMAEGGMSADNMADVDPGPLGGVAKCGDSKTDGVKTAVCAWSDNGSVGMFVMFFKSKADLEKEFTTLRGEVEHKK